MSGGTAATAATAAASTSAWSIAALAAGVASAGVGAYGSISSGIAQSNQAKAEAQVAANNATIAQQNAVRASQSGEQQAAESEQKTRAQVGAIKAAQAANGTDVNSGTNVDVRSSAAAQGELNALTIRSNAARTAYGYQTQSQSYQTQSNLDNSQASNAAISGGINGASTLLSGAGKAAQYIGGSGMNAGSAVEYSGPIGPQQMVQ